MKTKKNLFKNAATWSDAHNIAINGTDEQKKALFDEVASLYCKHLDLSKRHK